MIFDLFGHELTAFNSMIKFCTISSVKMGSVLSFIRFIIFDHKFSHTGIASTSSISFNRKVASPQELIKNRPTFSSKPGITNGSWIRSIGDDLQSEIVASLTTGPSRLIRAAIDIVVNSGYLKEEMAKMSSTFFGRVLRSDLHFLTIASVIGFGQNWLVSQTETEPQKWCQNRVVVLIDLIVDFAN